MERSLCWLAHSPHGLRSRRCSHLRLETRSFFLRAQVPSGTQAFQPSYAVFPCALPGNEIESGAAGTQTGVIKDGGTVSGNLTCHATAPALLALNFAGLLCCFLHQALSLSVSSCSVNAQSLSHTETHT